LRYFKTQRHYDEVVAGGLGLPPSRLTLPHAYVPACVHACTLVHLHACRAEHRVEWWQPAARSHVLLWRRA